MKNKIMLFLGLLIAGFVTTASAQGPGGQRRTAEERTKMQLDRMKEQLSLTQDQVTKLDTILLNNNKEMDKIFQSGQRPDRETMQKNREAQNEKIKAVLTEEQYKKYQEEQQKMRERRGQGGPGGQGNN
ncbi:hypothetical protein MKQ68_04580 [Chitinophaga horti]|uniref:DUF4890 domain-containing protein n=1 Tax=Chitinophaga horti TaxID=2920382 RepID=A0ABY6J7U5_9BACT|nr:hypothetical protein [Chitinophaga horti]UYQ94364.1 hypothetical protein MKQ68_04580 [Chitinophaga horti]